MIVGRTDQVLIFGVFSCEGGKGVKKAIKKVASGLVRDAEKSWFAELSDKGKMLVKFSLLTDYRNFGLPLHLQMLKFSGNSDFSEMYKDSRLLCNEKPQW